MSKKTTDPKALFLKLSLGEKIMVVASAVAILSFLLPWVDIGFTSRNAFSQGTFLLFALYAYPLYQIYNNKPFNKAIGIFLGCLAIVATVIYIQSKSFDWFGENINAASTGAYLFVITSIGFVVGLSKCKK